jgi:thioredoxin reductase (NADPH)
MVHKLVILGSGPAGLTAAIYAARDGLEPIVLAGPQKGGQLVITTLVENFPGFPKGIMGPKLMENMEKQARHFGAKIVEEEAVKVDFKVRPFKIWTEENLYEAHTVIVATGAVSKWLGIQSEQRLIGRGVSSCATCDGFFFKGKEVVVVGGGNTAMEDSIFLTRFATKVTVIHRRDKLRASKILQERAFKNPKIQFVWNSVIDEVLGEEEVEGVIIRDVKTGKKKKITCQGVFIAIGYKPNTEIFKGQLEMDSHGYLIVKDGTQTNIKGVFAAGDVHDYRYRQAITAAGDGCRAALDAERYLEEEGLMD